jgi:ribosomal protein S18 acetylase RimI-like enzyme
MTIQIRAGTPDDLARVQALNLDLFQHDAKFDPHLDMDWPHSPKGGEKYFQSRLGGEGVVLVAEVSGEIVGYLAGAIRPNFTYRDGRQSELENMCVDVKFRRSGVGSALTDAFTEWSRRNGADEIYVSAAFGNERGVRFYQSRGFDSYAHDLLLNLRDRGGDRGSRAPDPSRDASPSPRSR